MQQSDRPGESAGDPHFRQLWAAHHVAMLRVGTKVLHRPVAGDLTLDRRTLTASIDPDQQRVVRTAEAGTPSRDGLAWSGLPRPARHH
ncbi:hypothetical protein [Streptomyces sp. bgisy031]|uniref:MmyB family transcriptional regulator n=1 Tax=Streptomyces sp. bgisy031 TaxID=3413772 RepID=UPI003D72622B